MTTTDMPPGAADDLPRRRRGRAMAPDQATDPTAGPADGGVWPPGGSGRLLGGASPGGPTGAPPPSSRRAARLAASRQDGGQPVVLPPGPAQRPPSGQGPAMPSAPVGSTHGAVAAGVVGRSAYGGTDSSFPAQFAGYPAGPGPEPVLDLDALARGADPGGPFPPGVHAVGDLQVGPADLQVGSVTTPIRRRRPGSLPESFDVPDDGAEPEPDRATTPIRTQARPPRTGALRLRRGPKDEADPAAPVPPAGSAPPVVSASPGGAPFAAAPPTGAIPLADATPPGMPYPGPARPEPPVPGRGGPALVLRPDPPRPPAGAGPAGRADGVPVPPPLPSPSGPAAAEHVATPVAPAGAASPSRRSRRRAAEPGDPPDGRQAGVPAPALPGADPGRDDYRAAGPEQARDHGPDRAHGAEPATQVPPRRNRAGRNLPMAIAVGVGLAAVVLASLLVRKEAFVAVVCIASVLAVWELAGALAAKEITVPVVPLAVGSVGMLVSAFVAGEDGLLVSFALTSFGVLLWRIIDGPQDAARDVAASVFAAAYVPFLAGFTMLMLAAPDGAMRIIVFILLVVASDTGGYTAGVLFGKHPMAPTVSPHKSWEGFAGSTVACMAAGSAGVILLLDGVWYAGVAAGAAAVVTATVGDLSESLLKRDLGIKDMGSLLPGHGGMLDRIDSLLLTAPVVYVLLSLLVPVG